MSHKRLAFEAAGLLICASLCSGLRKIAFQVEAPGLHGIVHAFRKPIFTTLVSCLASAVLGLSAIAIARSGILNHSRGWEPLQSSPAAAESESLQVGSKSQGPVTEEAHWATQVLARKLTVQDWLSLAVPSFCYFMTITLAGSGMLLIPASMAFMVQGSCIIFTAACTLIVFPERKLNSLHIRAILSSMAGIGIVSIAGYVYTMDAQKQSTHTASESLPLPTEISAESPQLPDIRTLLSETLQSDFSSKEQSVLAASSDKEPVMVASMASLVWGVVLTLLSQLTQAMQFVSEEALTGSANLHPLQMLAVEGVLSTLFSLIAVVVGVLLPGHDVGGQLESLTDTFEQLKSPSLFLVCLVVFLGYAGNNFFGIQVSKGLGSVFRTVLLSLRTVLIWSGNLAVFYSHLSPGVGERWDSLAGPIQLVGFVFLLAGTLLYARGGAPTAAQPEAPTYGLLSVSATHWDSEYSAQSLNAAWTELALKPDIS